MHFGDVDKEVIYIDLESILDMRQGFLASKGIDKETIFEYIKSEEYNNRPNDRLMGFEIADYREAVDGGDLEVLKGSILNFNLSLLSNKSASVARKSSAKGTTSIADIWLNTYPYTFTEEEEGLIKSAIFSRLSTPAMVNTVCLSLEKISPMFIEENNIKHVFIYNFNKWLDLFTPVFASHPIPDVEVHFPPLAAIDPDPNILKVFKDAGFRDPFSYLEFQNSTTMKLSFLPLIHYNNYFIASEVLEVYNTVLKDTSKEIDEETEKTIEEMIDEHFGE